MSSLGLEFSIFMLILHLEDNFWTEKTNKWISDHKLLLFFFFKEKLQCSTNIVDNK
jgi:hypothetical protein